MVFYLLEIAAIAGRRALRGREVLGVNAAPMRGPMTLEKPRSFVEICDTLAEGKRKVCLKSSVARPGCEIGPRPR